MNDTRRRKLAKIRDKIEQQKSVLEDLKWEEEDAMESFPESLHGSARYEEMESAAYSMDEMIEELERVMDALDELTEK